MMAPARDLWSLAVGPTHVDPADLAAAVEDQVRRGDLDYRSRVLVRDSVAALRRSWGEVRVETWLNASPVGPKVKAVCGGPWDDDRGFPSLVRRVRDVTRPETIEQFLRELAHEVRRPVRLLVGGSAALILPGLLVRATEDIDVVDEVPAEVRDKHQVLDGLAKRYGLRLTHFQRHFLPVGWENRVHSLPPFGTIQVSLVDAHDVFVSKLFSARSKDLDDLRVLAPRLDKATLSRRLKKSASSLLAVPDLRENADKNWYILYGESLPT